MNRKIILATHGDLASGMLDTVRMVLGESPIPITTYCLHPGENPLEFATNLEKEIARNCETNYLVITDVYGGSVCTAMLTLLDNDNVTLLTGMNVSMVLTAIIDAGADIEHVGREGVRRIDRSMLKYSKDDEF